MENTFSEELIYTYNNNLKEGDLDKLDKLSYFYDVFSCVDLVFHYDFQTILNYLVLNELPYFIASKLMFDNKLIHNFIEYDGEKVFIVGDIFGSDYIQSHINKINKILQDET